MVLGVPHKFQGPLTADDAAGKMLHGKAPEHMTIATTDRRHRDSSHTDRTGKGRSNEKYKQAVNIWL